jgi:hypothetical protein
MTDEELVKRLRDEHLAMTRNEAAAAIEALTAERDMATEGWAEATRLIDVARQQYGAEKSRAEAAEAKLAKAVEAVSLTVRADNLREAYHALPNDHNRIGDKRSRKGHAREAWLRAFRKAAKTSRATLAEIEESNAT